MSIDSTVTAPQDAASDAPQGQVIDQVVDNDVEELLVEEVSIDGMCGVY
jgi:mycofactocin precursor